MSARFDTDNEGFTRIANLLNYNSVYSWCAWIYLITDRNDYTTLFSLNDGAVGAYDHLGTDSDGTTLRMSTAPFTANDINGSALSPNTWYHIALVREASDSIKAYLNGALDIEGTADDGTSRAAVARNEISIFTGLTRYFGGRVAGIKMWDAALTQGEIQLEMLTIVPRRFANINAWYPVLPGAGQRHLDYSGNGRHWTESGTLSDEDSPPVPWSLRSSLFGDFGGTLRSAFKIGKATLDSAALTTLRTFTLPNASGTLKLANAAESAAARIYAWRFLR